MTNRPVRAHPYMPNSNTAAHDELMSETGVKSMESLFQQIPADHRISAPIDLPPALTSEVSLSRHMHEILSKNVSCEDAVSFLGGGCWRHYVPAVCEEVMGRSEFLTSVWGTPSSDVGRNQAWFEFQSQLGELLALDMVGLPVYSWGCAAGHAIRMASRMTERFEVLVPRYMSPERRSVIENYCEPEEMPSAIRIVEFGVDPETGCADLADIKAKLSDRTAAIYLENPGFLGVIEQNAAAIGDLAHQAGAELIVGVDPVSLGVLAPPSDYGADIVVGSIQPLGIRMYCGGGLGGFIASRDEERYAREYPTLMISIAETERDGEVAFGNSLFAQCSYGSREEGKDWTGNSVYLWAIGSAVYMSLLGPEGFRELGETILQRAHYCAVRLAEIPGIKVSHSGWFKEFTVNFDGTGKSVSAINEGLRRRGVFGGLDLSGAFPELGQSALYCVTEMHTEEDIQHLATALKEVCAQ